MAESNDSFCFRPVNHYEVKDALENLNTRKAIGYEGSSASIVEEKLLSEGSKITEWYKENLLQVNVQKYQSMLMDSGTEAKNSINLHKDLTDIERSKSIKLLGVLLDSELNFSEHITLVFKKTSRHIGVLSRLRKLIPTYAKLQLYKAAILPHLTYCSTIWHFCRASDKRKAERLQERALRVVFNDKSLSYDGLLKLAEIPSLVNRRLQDIAILMFKAKKNLLPCQIQELFMSEVNCDRRYSLRNADFRIPRFNTVKYGKHSIRYYGPLLWSKLTKELRSEESLHAFKSKIRRTDMTVMIDDGCKKCALCNS
ncbi:hypothetical protein AWC38_SpisGene24297 [Stylophora pistillata]|uniref:RNA-directed DNA polymerase from mobile element jockey n=1 Tax=Stylophora pistillata TaxID=50429 RepID=A0A2B4R0B3_STYPI|nr:hypothetical protein AWC38_SpisGene24297 [Stylophora pistillata]